MPSMDNESSNVSQAEEIKVQANEAFKGTDMTRIQCFSIAAF